MGDQAAASAPVLSARGLVKRYGTGASAVTALAGVDLDIAAGTLTAVMGPSGSGKTTLVHLLAGLDTPDAGEIRIAGRDITAMDDRDLAAVRGTSIGFVFQGYNLMPTLTGRDNIRLPLRLNSLREDTEWMASLADALGLEDLLDRRPHEMSGGQQQRIAIARALVARPAVVLADEPTGALDRHAAAEILSHLRSATRELGQSVVMVTHDPTAAVYASRVLLLADGRIDGHIDNPTPESVMAGLNALNGVDL